MGGGIKIKASPAIQDCLFENCRALVGGAIYVAMYGITPVINGCIFRYDSTTMELACHGGAIYYGNGSSLTVSNCIFDSNYAYSSGGAIYSAGQNALIEFSVFYDNYCPGNGGAITTVSTAVIRNCTFAKNAALYGDALLAGTGSNVAFERNIVAFNGGLSGAVRANMDVTISFACNDFWDNYFGSITGTYDSLDADPYTIFEDPLLCSLTNDDYSISAYSPCDEDYSPCGRLIGCYPASCGVGIVGDGSLYSKWKNVKKADNLPSNEAHKIVLGSNADNCYSATQTELSPGLSCNYPNPFNPITSIRMHLPVASTWSIVIFNSVGQRLEGFGGYNEAGILSITWDASGYPSGVYFYKVKASNISESEKNDSTKIITIKFESGDGILSRRHIAV